jgi:hypothetical protein
MINKIPEIKGILLQILEDAFQAPDITATQQLGVNMSSALKKEGMVIIQNQNVEVYARIIPSMVKAIKLCDSSPPEILEITHHSPPKVEPEDTDPINECCSFLYEQNINWEDMQTLMKARYAEFILSKFKTKTEAAKFLGVGPTYFCKISNLITKKPTKTKMTII